MKRAHPRTMLAAALLLALLDCAPAPARAEDREYAVRVDLVLLRGARTRRTDAGVHVPRDGGATRDLEEGDILVPGDTLRVLYGDLHVYLADSDGNRFVVECALCTELEPMELRIGESEKGEPFVQTGGEVSYRVEKVRSGIFEILLRVLTGPEDRTIPVGVKGTVFLLEAKSGTVTVTVADGAVTVGGADNGYARDVPTDAAVTAWLDGWKDVSAPSGKVARILEITGPKAVMSWKGPPEGIAKSHRGWVRRAGPWVALGLGVAAGMTGGVMHYLAKNEADAVRRESKRVWHEIEHEGQTYADAAEAAYHDPAWNNRVVPKETSAWVLYGVGGALALGGTLWAILDRPEPAKDNPISLWPILDATNAGLVMGLTF